MELFAKIVNVWKSLTSFVKSSILNVWLVCMFDWHWWWHHYKLLCQQHHVSKYCDTIIKQLLTSKKFSIFYINLATTDDAVIVKITWLKVNSMTSKHDLWDLLMLYQACNFTKINTPPWVFFTFFKLYKWYQIAQRTTYYQLS